MTKNILLIEDDQFFQKFYSTKLKESGFNIDEASDGEEGLKKMKNGKFDLIMLDLVMPKMDGFQVLKARTEQNILPNIPIIVFTTLGQDKDIQEAKRLGATDYMNKTFYNFEQLLKKIQTLLN
jgi:CheY-like chemotaxis protein